MEWVIALVSLLVGVTAGYFMGRRGDGQKKRADDLNNQLDNVNTELNEYRSHVNQHFVRTAELVETLAENSRQIYQHLAAGSQKLCDTDVVKVQLSQDKAKPLSQQSIPAAKPRSARDSSPSDEDGHVILAEPEAIKTEKLVH